MKTKMTKTLSLTAAAALLALGQAPAAEAATFFDADFNGTSLTEVSAGVFMAEVNATNLNAGTATGTWSVATAQGLESNRASISIQGVGAANVTNKGLRFGISTEGTGGANTAVATGNLSSNLSLANTITVSFDYASGSQDGNASNPRITYLTGRDSSDNRLFQLAMLNSSGARQVGYIDNAGTLQLLGSVNDLNATGSSNNADGDFDDTIMKTISVDVGASSYEISLAGSSLASGIAFRDGAASGLDSLEFGSNNKFTGGWFDNITVDQVPEPGSLALMGLGGLLIARRRRG